MAADLFDTDDPFGLPPIEEEQAGANAPAELTVSEVSQQLKRMVEKNFSFVRIRGEISRVTVAKSGHMYTSLKDADAVLDAVCWKGTMSRLGLRPEEGMDVVCTGRLTTYPGRSNYQLIIETMELAGQGALLKMLEERRKKLAAEGLFDASRKKPVPFLPRIIGVVTSPTGAVIRDILHRLADRFPRRVIVWPVMVQGQGAAQQVAAAISGFNALPPDSPHRPDVLIVARGGGSLEDLMPFNDEALVRTAAASAIPLISAVGHETDTTLIDYAADLRAPTPTAAAEMAVPVRAELVAGVNEMTHRLSAATQRGIKQHRIHLDGLARGLGDPRRMLETATQKHDHLSQRLDAGLAAWLEKRRGRLAELSAQISPRPVLRRIADTERVLSGHAERLSQAAKRLVAEREKALSSSAALLDSLSFERVLDRGYAVVFDGAGNIISSAEKAQGDIDIRFRDGTRKAKI
ncbi:MAG: exodeoxyribonuclease VII large subunit [Alphaproteobacteria bacterium]|nr:exodeoxyribonuclease VII large subunit [Alphaproteobacteria bacterium]